MGMFSSFPDINFTVVHFPNATTCCLGTVAAKDDDKKTHTHNPVEIFILKAEHRYLPARKES